MKVYLKIYGALRYLTDVHKADFIISTRHHCKEVQTGVNSRLSHALLSPFYHIIW